MIEQRKNLFIIGLMGGIASGKSTVANVFRELGGVLINADDMVHQTLQDSDIQKEICNIWGNHLLINGDIDKTKLASIVFSSKKNLQKLENIIHPVIRRGIHDKLQNLAKSGKYRIILDIALLWERGLHEGCDLLVFVDSDIDERIHRTVEKRGWQPDQLVKRESYQDDLATKRNAANIVIKNSDIEEMYSQARKVWRDLPSF